MKKYLNIGEVARLMNMTTSQIRFYEKKELLKPNRYDESGYRMYTFEDIDRLEAISLFKDINVAIKDIKNSFDQDNDMAYQDIINESEHILIREIVDLKQKLQRIRQIKKDFLTYNNPSVVIEYYDKRTMAIINEQGYQEHSERELYQFLQNNKFNYMDYDIVFYGLEKPNGERIFCYFDRLDRIHKSTLGSYSLPKGRYATLKTTIESKDDIVPLFIEFENECIRSGLELEGDSIVVDPLESQIYSKNKKYITFQRKIKD